jgi:CRISPR-associated protein Csb2
VIHIAATWRVGLVQAHTPSREPEWPPHPERLIETLLAGAWARDENLAHRRALRTLEGQAPKISLTRQASDGVQMHRYGRYVQSSGQYAKVDGGGPKFLEAECAFLTVPIFVGDGPHAVYSYDLPEDPERDALLAEVLSEVWYVGESASSVTLRLVEKPPEGMRLFVPDRRGERPLRIPLPGRLDTLEAAYARRIAGVTAATRTSGGIGTATKARGEAEASAQRDLANGKAAWIAMREFREAEDAVAYAHYREAGEAVVGRWHLEAAIFLSPPVDIDGRNFEKVIADYRIAWLDSLRRTDPELTGHEIDGTPAARQHVGFIPLLDVGRPYAEGSLQGIGVLIPRDLEDAVKREAFAAVERTASIRGREQRMILLDEDSYVENAGKAAPRLRIARQMRRASREWATFTPAIPFRYTKSQALRRDPDALRPAVLEMFARAGLPEPRYVRWAPASIVSGAPHTATILRDPHLPPARHLIFGFDEEVQGPIVLGRRAWKGYGACLPLSSR